MSKVYKRQVAARKELEEIWSHPENVNVIHYSCESFYDRPDGSSPRITSIAVRNLKTGQTQSFSIHKFGELHKYPAGDLNGHYDELEKEMLDAFFELVKERKEYKWLHWNMRDENYGFHAIELRHKILGGEPFVIPDPQKFDLSRILIGIYGKGYIGHPRLENLIKKNAIKSLGFRTGKEESELFEKGNYVCLHQSTLAKVDVFASICQQAYEGSLKTDAKWLEVHGHSLNAFVAWLSNHPVITLFSILANIGFVIQLIWN
ncbi:MAG: hypothetical protein EOM12_14920 [Verrucomicrobiae bacterium]|nr:hypothetical protein [Verrucomicrobiae bacterium]